ncbi:triose-phosphate isomerase [Thermodesulfobacteriota bacterium]
MTKYVLANWKSHKILAEAEHWMTTFIRLWHPSPEVKVIVAPPAVYLDPLWKIVQDSQTTGLSLAVQDLSPFPLGAYTGAVAAEMIRDRVDYALVGHSERRRYFHETNQEIVNKVGEATAAGITPIVCVERHNARAQLAAMNNGDTEDLMIGYGPTEAIGINIAQSPDKVLEAVGEIKAVLPGNPILYGGSILPENAGIYMGIPGITGVMVGSASLDPETFVAICETVARS